MSDDMPNSRQEDSNMDPVALIPRMEEVIRHWALLHLAVAAIAGEDQSEFRNRGDIGFNISRSEDGKAVVVSSEDYTLTGYELIHLSVHPEDKDCEPFIIRHDKPIPGGYTREQTNQLRSDYLRTIPA